jgi:osmotically-inducible protein OsmY
MNPDTNAPVFPYVTLDPFGAGGYVRSDGRILEEVAVELSEHEGIDDGQIDVHVHDGEVTLLGSVPAQEMVSLAEGAAAGCRGVRAVHTHLMVRPL